MSQNQQYIFGPGALYGTNLNANSTPRRFGELQDCSIDFAYTEKELYGSNQFPIAIARATAKVTGKAKFVQVNASVYNDLFFNQTQSTTLVNNTAVNEIQAIGATVNATNHTTWTTDLGVIFSNGPLAGIALTLVSGSPTISGTYSVAAGVYSFCSADVSAGNAVALNYVYTSSVGAIITGNNPLIGVTPMFSIVFNTQYNGNQTTVTFPQCTSSKLNLPGKQGDFTVPELDFSVMANGSGQVFTISTTAI
jgi:hypothetical protein